MVRLVQNERSWAIDLIGHINRVVEAKTLQIKKAGGETTINNRKSTTETKREIMFPDVLLYEDSLKSKIIQGWEVKLPDVPVTDEEYIKDAQYKADVLGLNSTVLWNFNSVVLYVKNKNNQWELYHQWNELSHIRTREGVEIYQEDWLNLLEDVLVQLNEYFTNDTIQTTKIEMMLTESLMAKILNHNKSSVSERIKEASAADRVIDIHLNNWWKEAEIEYKKDESSMYSAYSKLIISNWLIKITFAHLIKSHHNPAKKVEKINIDLDVKDAIKIFKEITSECDFYTIFYPLEYSEVIPLSFWRDLTDYNAFLSDQGFNNLNHEVLQTLLEKGIKSIRREIIGQFTTPVLLADLLVKSTIREVRADVIDPCCGSGTIAKSAMNLKKAYLDERDAHSTVWASDKYQYPLQLANLALTEFSSIHIANKVFHSNVFDIFPEGKVLITSPLSGEIEEYTIPKFKTVVSNLPFVPFEIISEDEKANLLSLYSGVQTSLGIELSKRSDLYTYITVHLWNLMDVEGRVGLILSNSWLGTISGREFYEVLRKLYQVEYILISGNKRWFKNADVVTTMLVLTKKQQISDVSGETRFGILQCPLDELSEKALSDEIANHILAKTNIAQAILTTTEYSEEQIIELLNFRISINALFHDINWLISIRDYLIPLTNEFKIIRGMRRGWDPMFYPEKGHKIEPEYIQPVLKSSRSVTGLTAFTDSDAFCCSDSVETIQAKNNYGAYNWINKFKNQLNKVGQPLVESLQKSAGKDEFWYEMNTKSQAEIVTTMNPDKRLFYSKLDNKGFINQRLIGLLRKSNNSDLELNHALLNSLIGVFFIEAVGFGRGLGALDLNSSSLAKTSMLNPTLLSEENKTKIIIAFEALKSRSLLPFLKEIQQEDRVIFEKTVLESYGLLNLFEPIKNSIVSMQTTRLAALTV
ncbi:N-6 DNA methylase [Bacillus pumilus]|uniref:N-6 DNA methylase n=1 Tax=Bacillus TaxID=1386 RepID=UPI0016227F3A|nr:N-6 DNA methylase [Bacillus pumilus]MBB6604376.1 N-6 DNA methylase [Bacillus pumilus]